MARDTKLKSDETMPQKPETVPQRPEAVEIVPSIEDSISGLASANAPFIYFESAPAFGAQAGTIKLTLTASRIMPRGTQAKTDHVVVAHLRTNLQGAVALKTALESVLLMFAQPQQPTKPN